VVKAVDGNKDGWWTSGISRCRGSEFFPESLPDRPGVGNVFDADHGEIFESHALTNPEVAC